MSTGVTIRERSQRQLLTFVAGIAVAATGGALVGMGRRLGSASIGFAGIGAALVHRAVNGREALLVAVGIIVHVLVTLAWSVAFTALVRRFGRPLRMAIGVALCSFLLSRIVTQVTGGGVASVLALGDRIVLAAVLAAALVMGMRFALSRSRGAASYDAYESRERGDDARSIE